MLLLVFLVVYIVIALATAASFEAQHSYCAATCHIRIFYL